MTKHIGTTFTFEYIHNTVYSTNNKCKINSIASNPGGQGLRCVVTLYRYM